MLIVNTRFIRSVYARSGDPYIIICMDRGQCHLVPYSDFEAGRIAMAFQHDRTISVREDHETVEHEDLADFIHEALTEGSHE